MLDSPIGGVYILGVASEFRRTKGALRAGFCDVAIARRAQVIRFHLTVQPAAGKQRRAVYAQIAAIERDIRAISKVNRISQGVDEMVRPFEKLYEEESWIIDSGKEQLQKKENGKSDGEEKGREAPAAAPGKEAPKLAGLKIENEQRDLEPWVRHAPQDRVGLALSGGGIRSATFNLGLLQGLVSLRILQDVDYLATVSGGGYIGGWFSAWRHRRPADVYGDLVPHDENQGETARIRHLREFSKFLSPRVSIFEVVLWYGIISVLGGLLIGLMSATAVIVLVYSFWIVLTRVLWGTSAGDRQFWAFGAMTLIWLTYFECRWRRDREEDDNQSRRRKVPIQKTTKMDWLCEWSCSLIIPAVLAIVAWQNLHYLWPRIFNCPEGGRWCWHQWNANDSLTKLPGEQLSSWIFAPVAAWGATVGFLAIVRFLVSRLHDIENQSRCRAAGERAMARLVGGLLLWSTMVFLWLLGKVLFYDQAWIYVAGLALTSGGVFAWIRNWVARSLSKPQAPGILNLLKPKLPQLLAYVTVGLGAMLVASLMMVGVEWVGILPVFLAALGVVVLVLVYLDPAVIGLHAFYRDRIARAYLGAPTLHVTPQPEDDFRLDAIRYQRPIHLVCTAANGLQDDPLSSLNRCSRSAVLSGNGITIGNCWRAWEENNAVRMGDALTASAAAFNSNMGSVSSKLGPAVTFLMTALNLRLGLWVPHPCGNGKLPFLSGRLFFREMFGRTSCKTPCFKQNAEAIPCERCTWPGRGSNTSAVLHLSDGAHFENLALYELVRRHCRYIIVSDCGEDREVKMDDFGNAVRRVREDFGVDIEINLDPLRPVNGVSQQHMAVGTIHYDRQQDKGILLYFKTSLTGDEPVDVMQYQARNSQFPHETTGDQFYDEAQWESYRRLGEHVACAALGFVERLKYEERVPHRVFTEARLEWYPGPADLRANVFVMTERYSELEREIAESGLPDFRDEMFDELQTIGGGGARTEVQSLSNNNIEKTLALLLQMIQFMEDVFNACYLEAHSGHPLNLGWYNLFQRWVYMPSFQAWWPILQTLYGPNLRRYIDERLYFSRDKPKFFDGNIIEFEKNNLRGLAWDRWKIKDDNAREPIYTTLADSAKFYAYDLKLSHPKATTTVQVAIVPVGITEGVATWKSGDLLIIPGLWDTQLGVAFLKKLIQELKKKNVRKITVTFDNSQHSDRAKRDLQTDIIEMYTAANFRLSYDNEYVLRYDP